MTKVLVLGMAPLSFENQPHVFGPSLRTWQFVQPLLDDGHEVCLCSCRIYGAYDEKEASLPITTIEKGALVYHHMDQATFERQDTVQGIHDRFSPDCIVGATVYPSSRAVRLRTSKPIWIDVYGDLMSEAQAKAYVFDNDHYLFHFWSMNKPILENGDIYSSVSNRQKYALMGQLATVGRLNKHSMGYDFVHVIPCGIEKRKFRHERRVLRGIHVDDEDFAILWNGGFNTWTDVNTLFQALEMAMTRNHHIRFVCAGAEIPGHDEITYKSFTRLVENSKLRGNFVLLGWVHPSEIHNYYFEADVGINVDRPCYEAVLGSRNRILGWLQAGLPVLTTDLTELGQILKDSGIATTCRPNSPKELARSILQLAGHPSLLRKSREARKRFVFQNFTYEKTTAPLREWVRNPSLSPDHGMRIPLNQPPPPQPPPGLWDSFQALAEAEGIGVACSRSIRWLLRKMSMQAQ
jgi:glycosyltransferase involved in cell wall biosynthesis